MNNDNFSVTVFRLEGKFTKQPTSRGVVCGWGPYASQYSFPLGSEVHGKIREILSGHNSLTGHPNPHNDNIESFISGMFCGFLFMEDLIAWFGSCNMNLFRDAGFKIQKYKIAYSDIHAGSSGQICFWPEDLLESLDD